MSACVLISGSLFRAPESRMSKAGRSFVTATCHLTVPILGRDHVVEVRARKDELRELHCWLEQRDILIVKANRKTPLVILRTDLSTTIALGAERSKGGAQ